MGCVESCQKSRQLAKKEEKNGLEKYTPTSPTSAVNDSFRLDPMHKLSLNLNNVHEQPSGLSEDAVTSDSSSQSPVPEVTVTLSPSCPNLTKQATSDLLTDSPVSGLDAGPRFSADSIVSIDSYCDDEKPLKRRRGWSHFRRRNSPTLHRRDLEEVILNIVKLFPFPSPRTSPRTSPVGGRRRRHSSVIEEPSAESPSTETSEGLKASDKPTFGIIRPELGKPYGLKRRRKSKGPPSGNKRKDSKSKRFRSIFRSHSQPTVATPGIQALALTSVDLTTQAVYMTEWLKDRLQNFAQITGHEGTIIPTPNKTLYKQRLCDDSNEASAYEDLMKDSLRPFVPKYYGQIEKNGEYFIEIEDLMQHFNDPVIIDIKVGIRTFLECEVSNPQVRPDLYKKMVAIDPNEPTDEENQAQAITKLRYMQFRERESSTQKLGFRLEAMMVPGGDKRKTFKHTKTREQVIDGLWEYLSAQKTTDPVMCSQRLLERLRELRAAADKSEFLKTHEVIGSSILILYDCERVGVWCIDFAKSLPLPDGIKSNHLAAWELGNHEDGWLFGLDEMIQLVDETHFRATQRASA